jgi:hypothetical protein
MTNYDYLMWRLEIGGFVHLSTICLRNVEKENLQFYTVDF